MKRVDLSLLPHNENDHLFKKTGLKHFVNLVRTGLNDLGILHLQFNCIDKQTLLDAQKNPEKYPTLLVRVAGYSVYFTDLAKCIQDDIISRTEHRLT